MILEKNMENINSFFGERNIFATYPTSFKEKQKSISSLATKDILSKDNADEINKEISMYLDILYKDTDEELLKKTDKLKLNSAYLPIKCLTQKFNNFYL